MLATKEIKRKRRHARVRRNVKGSAERPRLSVFKSLNHIYAQIVDDAKGVTLVSASTMEKSVKQDKGAKGNVNAAKSIGSLIGKKALDKGIKQVVFDRGGYPYHGRVKALADGAREAGLQF